MRVSVRVSSAAAPLHTPQLFVQRLRIHFEWWLQVILPWVAATSRAMSKKSKIFYQIHECVFPCSHNSLKNARLWAYTEEEVKQAYKLHLDNSGLHSKLSKEEKEQGMREVKVVQEDWADYEDPPSGKKRARDMWENHNAASSGAASALGPEEGATAALRRRQDGKYGRLRCGEEHPDIALAKRRQIAEKKRQMEDDAEFEAWAEEVHEEEVITVNKRDLVDTLSACRRAIQAAEKCGDFMDRGSAAFKTQTADFLYAKGAVERMLLKEE